MTAELDRAMRHLYIDARSRPGAGRDTSCGWFSELGGLNSFTTLHLHGHLDLTVEATVLANPAFTELFAEDELDTTRE